MHSKASKPIAENSIFESGTIVRGRPLTNRKTVVIGAFLLLGAALVMSCLTEESSAPEATPDIPPTDTLSSMELPPSSFLPEVPRISVEEVKRKLDTGANIVIVDSRSKASYDQAHIAGAVSLPLADMSEPYDDLDGYDEIITYCT